MINITDRIMGFGKAQLAGSKVATLTGFENIESLIEGDKIYGVYKGCEDV